MLFVRAFLWTCCIALYPPIEPSDASKMPLQQEFSSHFVWCFDVHSSSWREKSSWHADQKWESGKEYSFCLREVCANIENRSIWYPTKMNISTCHTHLEEEEEEEEEEVVVVVVVVL